MVDIYDKIQTQLLYFAHRLQILNLLWIRSKGKTKLGLQLSWRFPVNQCIQSKSIIKIKNDRKAAQVDFQGSQKLNGRKVGVALSFADSPLAWVDQEMSCRKAQGQLTHGRKIGKE
jgi:hypothetical protein